MFLLRDIIIDIINEHSHQYLGMPNFAELGPDINDIYSSKRSSSIEAASNLAAITG